MYNIGWKQLDKKAIDNLDSLKDVPGIYWIRCGMKIPRLFGVDKEGLLMIGATGNLEGRIWAFYMAATGIRKTMQHIEGQRYHYFEVAKLHKNSLQFKYQETKNRKEAFTIENEQLEEYEKRHKELPPLNKSGGWKGR